MTNPAAKAHIAKVTVNIGVGEGGEKLQKAMKVLEILTKRKPAQTKAKKGIRDWNVRKGAPIGCKVTLRGEDAEEFLKKALWVRNNRLPSYSFDDNGNVSFGIPDYTAFEGMKYDPAIGVFGMDICITIEKPGYRIKHRRIMKRNIPVSHRVSGNEAIELMKERFGVEIA